MQLMIGRRLNKPYYIFRPRQILSRARRALFAPARLPAEEEATLPWGLPIRFDPRDAIGGAIARTGLYDLRVCEAICRLADPGELAVDVGANIGVMTSLLAVRSGPTGRVVAAEPHPEVFQRLHANVGSWAQDPHLAPVNLHKKALSTAPGRSLLFVDTTFDRNQGTASLERPPAVADAYEVDRVALDQLLPADTTVGVLKLDVEGHELEVLKGADGAISEHRIRDVLFECTVPAAPREFFESRGYTLFHVGSGLLGPMLRSVNEPLDTSWEPASLLATVDPDRARRRFAPKGWRVLQRPSR